MAIINKCVLGLLTLYAQFAWSANLSDQELQSLYTHQKQQFFNLSFPENIVYQRSSSQDVKAVFPNIITVPENSICSNKQMQIQVTHEIGHLLFMHWYKDQNADYIKLNLALKKQSELHELYDNAQGDLTKINQQISEILDEIYKYNYLFGIVFPIEELFADMFTLIYYDSATIMQEGLSCYGEEASERDYSTLVAVNYVPDDPYGHSDYLMFGYHYYIGVKHHNFSKSKSIELLYNKILVFIKKMDPFIDFNFEDFNTHLRNI